MVNYIGDYAIDVTKRLKMRHYKRKYQFQYKKFYIDRIFKRCYWKGIYKHYSNWNCKGLTNAEYYKIRRV